MANRRFAVMRDLQDHLEAGRISAFDLGIYVIVHWQADFRTGLWRGSAAKIHATAMRGCSLRDIQRAIENLKRIGFLVPFHTPGRRGNYPVLIHKYRPLSGALRGRELNALKTIDWRAPVYDLCAVTDAETDAEDAPIHNAVSSKQEKPTAKPRAAKPAAPADLRFQSFVEFAFKAFEVDHGQKPTWGPKDYANLKALLGNNKTVALGELELRWTHYLGSTEPFTVKQGGSLAYFCAHFDSFMAGPILERTGGKPDASALESRNLVAAGFPPLN